MYSVLAEAVLVGYTVEAASVDFCDSGVDALVAGTTVAGSLSSGLQYWAAFSYRNGGDAYQP